MCNQRSLRQRTRSIYTPWDTLSKNHLENFPNGTIYFIIHNNEPPSHSALNTQGGEVTMSRRFLGILYLVRALTPFVVIPGVAIAGVYAVNELQTILTPSPQELGDAVNELETEARTIQGELKQVSQNLTKVAETLEDFTDILVLILNIPNTIDIPRLDIPNVNVPLPKPEVKFSKVDLGVTDIEYPSNINISSTNFNMDIPAILTFKVPVPGLGELDNQLGQALKPVTSIFFGIQSGFRRDEPSQIWSRKGCYERK